MSIDFSIAFPSLVTASLDVYQQTVAFYKSLGFKLIKSYVRDAVVKSSSLELQGISTESLREAWLETFPPESFVNCNGLTLKVRLSDYAIESIDESNDVTHDTIKVVLYSTKLDKIRHILAESGHKIVDNPHKGTTQFDEYVFKTRDPIGNAVGFTDKLPIGNPVELSSASPSAATQSGTASSDSDDSSAVGEVAPPKRIAVMTSGGDSAGMNAAVRAVVRAAIFHKCEAFAVYNGYQGLVEGGNQLKKLSWFDVRGWLSLGGTLIGTARNQEFRTTEGRKKAAYNLVSAGIDALVVVGGDGSLTGADFLRNDWPELLKSLVAEGKITPEQQKKYSYLSIVGLVGSIDNDMALTDRTIGAVSALERISEMVDYIDATAKSHSRAFVVEVMGRHCGWLALMAGITTGADYIFIPERPENADSWQQRLSQVCERHRSKGNRKTTVIVAEGAIDNAGNVITSDDVKNVLVGLGLDTRVTQLGHVQRGGNACAYDRWLATMQGLKAVECILSNDSNSMTESLMVAVHDGQIVTVPLIKAVAVTKSVATAINAKDFQAAAKLRGVEFEQCYSNYVSTSICDDGSMELPLEKRLNIGVIHVGAPTSALNALTRFITLDCISKGHKVFAIQNGFSGLIRHGAVKELHWDDVKDWHNLGGSVIGTNRSLPNDDMGTVAYYMQKYALDGLVIAGGFEAYVSLQQLYNSRAKYPVFNFPIALVPSTVSNNVPGTRYSLGSDTCLNELVKYCDAIKQSASSSRKRVFIVEVQGGNCGYIAAYTSLITGAIASYLPEKRINLGKIREDVALLEQVYNSDKGENRSGKIFIRNEKASKIFTTELITQILSESSKGKFGARTAIPGHVQQGNTPSSLDRINACRMGIASVDFIEKWNNLTDEKEIDKKLRFDYENGVKVYEPNVEMSAAIMSIHGISLDFVPVSELKLQTEEALRRPIDTFWDEYSAANDILSGRAYLQNASKVTV